MDDQQRWEFYDDPARREPADDRPGIRRSRSTLTSYVPVRFPPELIVAVRLLALEDGQSVSSWIRTAVAHELERRTVPA
jgi:hypothetical protein